MSSQSVFDLSHCVLCPRECGVNRAAGQTGVCGETSQLRAARAARLYYEEPCISGTKGSGAVFFTGCNLGCVFCQNVEIASCGRPGLPRGTILSSGGSSNLPLMHPPKADAPRSEIREGDFADAIRNLLRMQQVDMDDKASALSSNLTLAASALSSDFVPCRQVITPGRLEEIFLELQDQGAANINLVTASHVVPLVIPALRRARNHGLSIPVVYNTSAYEKAEVIRALEGLVDIYLPDYKFRSGKLARRWCAAPDYPERAADAIAEMVRQCPEPLFEDGSSVLDEEDDADIPLMKRGVIVRHMVMPGQVEDSIEVLRYLHEQYGNRIFISIMNQYTPMPQCKKDPLLSRPVTKKEYDTVVDRAILLGIENGFVQEGETISRSFIPAWDGTGL